MVLRNGFHKKLAGAFAELVKHYQICLRTRKKCGQGKFVAV